MNKIRKVEEYLLDRYNFRYNIVLGRVEYEDLSNKGTQELTDYKINSVYRELLIARLPVKKHELIQLLQSEFVPLYDPFKHYFELVGQWDLQTDYIEQLATTVTVSEEEQELWNLFLRRWLIGVVACAVSLPDVNPSVLVFVGRQGVGKTKWMERLVPKMLRKYYYSGNINPNDKDSKINLSECFLVNLDELGSITKGDINSLKQLITLPAIRVRRPYASVPETIARRASFMGSVNSHEFLKDPTGNRRFLCVESLNIDYSHEFDIDRVYAQAYHLWTHGERYWFTQEENARIDEANLKYRMSFDEIELVNEYYEPCKKGDETVMLATAELQRDLIEKGDRLENLNLRRLGMALKASSYIRTKQKGLWKWYLKKKEHN